MKSTVSGRVVAECKCEYAWLVELFDTVKLCSAGLYCGVTALPHGYATTKSPFEAQRFSKEDAERVAPALPVVEGQEWRAIEHGFCE